MNRSMSRWAVVVVVLLAALVLAACQRERPAAEPEAWTTPTAGPAASPGVEVAGTPALTSVAAGTPLPAGQVAPGGFVTGTMPTSLAPATVTTPTEAAVLAVGATFGYVVKPGDTLFSIALTYDTDVDTIRRLNNLPDDIIQVGQVLIVPGTGELVAQPGQEAGTPGAPQPTATPQVVYVVQAGDNLSSIAAQFNVAWQDIAAANNIVAPAYTIFRGQKLAIPGVTATPEPTAVVKTHVVQPGETLFGIAVQYGITVQALMEANGLTDPNFLRVNQALIIPE